MKRRILFVFLVLVLLLSPLLACASPKAPAGTPAPPTPTATVNDKQTADIAALQARDTELTTAIQGKASTASVTALTERVTAVEGQSSANSYTKTEVYTKAQVDAKINEIIQQKINSGELGSGGSSGSSGSSGGSSIQDEELIDEDRSLELYLEDTDPSSDPFHVSAPGGGTISFDLIVANDDNDHHDFQLSLWLDPEDSVSISNINVDCYPDVGTWTITRNSFTSWNPTTGAVVEPLPSLDKIYLTMDHDKFIDDYEEEDFTVVISITPVTSTFYDYRWTIEETD